MKMLLLVDALVKNAQLSSVPKAALLRTGVALPWSVWGLQR